MPRYRSALIGAGLCLLTLCGAALPAAAQSAPTPAQARIWFYQQFLPGEAMGGTDVMLNGVVVGNSVPGQRFYRDVAPGVYRVAVASFVGDGHQDRDVVLAPGQELYIKIASLRAWASAFNYTRDTFYVWPMPTGAALAEIAQTTF